MARWWPYNTIIVSSIFVISWYWTVFHGKKSRTDEAIEEGVFNLRQIVDFFTRIRLVCPFHTINCAHNAPLTSWDNKGPYSQNIPIGPGTAEQISNESTLEETNVTRCTCAACSNSDVNDRSANLVISGGIDEINITVPTIVSTTVDTSSPPVVQTQAQTRIFRNRTRNTRSKNKEENAKS
ncbi:uncharacterized protein LOC105279023 isoform X3 [Ooceraea biroi]|uniref:uncharacterized protein LOC105279023 isoform X3 n=1 Tax=Ooceraea biroi TaxID=2015173 RepID=UPI00097168D2|nr:uncharacterized protein LOC105279023 isoform X3 [Ooceraea biroi]